MYHYRRVAECNPSIFYVNINKRVLFFYVYDLFACVWFLSLFRVVL